MVQMRAVVYDGPFKVSIQNVEKPEIQHPNDVIVKGRPILVSYRVMTDIVPPVQSRLPASAEGRVPAQSGSDPI